MTAAASRINFVPPGQGPTLDAQTFAEVVRLIRGVAGIHLGPGKRHLVQSRLARRLAAVGCGDYATYLTRHVRPHLKGGLPTAGTEAAHFVDALATNLTAFWREPTHFDFLRRDVLPQLVGERRHGLRRLRFWCAGCSTGEEPYTLAMVVRHAINRLHGRHASGSAASWDVKILATDISGRVLETARRGVYPADRVDALPAALRADLTALPGGLVRPVEAVRQCVRFRRLNLLEAWPFAGPFDAILCRNVMIYFDKPTQQELVRRLSRVLAVGGTLLTGHSESLTGITHALRFRQATVYERAA